MPTVRDWGHVVAAVVPLPLLQHPHLPTKAGSLWESPTSPYAGVTRDSTCRHGQELKSNTVFCLCFHALTQLHALQPLGPLPCAQIPWAMQPGSTHCDEK